MLLQYPLCLVAFDPGETTGYAIAKIAAKQRNLEWVEIGEFPNHQEVTRFITSSDLVICEDFFLGGMFTNLTPKEVIGAIKHVALIHNKPVVMSPPSRPKFVKAAYFAGRRLPKIVMGSVHTYEAVCHLVYEAVQRGDVHREQAISALLENSVPFFTYKEIDDEDPTA